MQTLDPNQQLGYLLVRVADQVSRAWFKALRDHAINPRQFSALAVLVREPSLSQAELARRVLVTPQSMTELIAALITAKLLRRRPLEPGHPAQLEVTARGQASLCKAYPVVEAVDCESFAALNPAERAELGRLLRKALGKD
jgi:DNA-binding MarR family transcriptional regulator